VDWAQILVIILAIFLALFLALGIALLVMLLRLTRQIKTVASSAHRTATHIERLVAGVATTVRPALLFTTFKKLLKRKRK
jgi:hypothetical protein